MRLGKFDSLNVRGGKRPKAEPAHKIGGSKVLPAAMLLMCKTHQRPPIDLWLRHRSARDVIPVRGCQCQPDRRPKYHAHNAE